MREGCANSYTRICKYVHIYLHRYHFIVCAWNSMNLQIIRQYHLPINTSLHRTVRRKARATTRSAFTALRLTVHPIECADLNSKQNWMHACARARDLSLSHTHKHTHTHYSHIFTLLNRKLPTTEMKEHTRAHARHSWQSQELEMRLTLYGRDAGLTFLQSMVV